MMNERSISLSQERGTQVFLTATIGGQLVLLVGRRDKIVHIYVGSCGTTAPAAPQKKKLRDPVTLKMTELNVPCCEVICIFSWRSCHS